SRRLVPEIEHHAGREAPFERHFVNGPRRLAFGDRAIVIGRIYMRAGVRDRLHFLDRPAQAVRVEEVLGLYTEESLHLLQALGIVPHVPDLRRHRLAGSTVLQRYAQVDQAIFWQHLTLLSWHTLWRKPVVLLFVFVASGTIAFEATAATNACRPLIRS